MGLSFGKAGQGLNKMVTIGTSLAICGVTKIHGDRQMRIAAKDLEFFVTMKIANRP